MKAYINAISAIGFQDLMNYNKGISKIEKLNESSELIQPDYKQWINPMQLRRMSKIVRMGLGCTKSIVDQIGTGNFDAVIVGTGLGCIQDTVKFIDTINAVSTSSIPPTSFIQSTHNTIAGQIALLLENNNYNMTYVQNGVSFEQALLDGILKIAEGKNNVLVGALDEMTEYIHNLAQLANIENVEALTEGSAFFNLSQNKCENTFATVSKSITYTIDQDSSLNEIIDNFLASENLSLENIDIIMEASPSVLFKESIKFEEYCGKYFTSSAFAFYLACLFFKESVETINTTFQTKATKIEQVLIVNNYRNKVVGLTLLSK